MRSVRSSWCAADGGVVAADVDDGERLRRAEVRVEGEADDDEELAHLVLAGEPHALVGLRVGRPHDADGIGRVVDQELVEPAERGVLLGGGVGRGVDVDVDVPVRVAVPVPVIVNVIVIGAHRVRGAGSSLSRSKGRTPVRAAGRRSLKKRVSSWVRTARAQYARDRGRGPAHRPAGRGLLRSGRTTTTCWHACAPRIRCTSAPRDSGPSPATRTSGTSAATRSTSARGGARWSTTPSAPAGTAMSARSILHMDPPEHAAFRGLVNRRFTPRALAGLAESIRKSAVGAARRRRARGGDRLRGRAGSTVPAHRDRRAARDRRGGPGGLPPLVRRGDRVTRPAARRDGGGARRALGVHRRAHPHQARAAGGGPGVAAGATARSAGARSAGRSCSCSS